MNKLSLFLFAFLAISAVVVADDAEKLEDLPEDCKDYPEAVGDDEHYCRFVFQKTFDRVAWAGAVACAVCVVLVSIIVIARDVLKVFDCCGVTKGAMAAGPPMRILTTMSAGYTAGNNGK